MASAFTVLTLDALAFEDYSPVRRQTWTDDEIEIAGSR